MDDDDERGWYKTIKVENFKGPRALDAVLDEEARKGYHPLLAFQVGANAGVETWLILSYTG